MVALAERAPITNLMLIGGWSVDAGVGVVGVAHSRRGELGQDSVEGRARFGVEQPVEAAHPVAILAMDRQEPLAGAVAVGLIGRSAILVE